MTTARFLLLLSSLFFATKSFSYPTELVAQCWYRQNDIQLDFKVLRGEDKTLVEVNQRHPRFPEPVQSIRHVAERITHDYWEYNNHFDFLLHILPGDKGKFTGKVYGVAYDKIPLSCEFQR